MPVHRPPNPPNLPHMIPIALQNITVSSANRIWEIGGACGATWPPLSNAWIKLEKASVQNIIR